jgi:hypothetical protein
MIGKDQIAETIRYNDAASEEHGLETFLRQRGVDIDGLAYVARQRGLRGIMALRGENPNVQVPTRVRHTEAETKVLAMIAAGVMDGFMAGLALGRKPVERALKIIGDADAQPIYPHGMTGANGEELPEEELREIAENSAAHFQTLLAHVRVTLEKRS